MLPVYKYIVYLNRLKKLGKNWPAWSGIRNGSVDWNKVAKCNVDLIAFGVVHDNPVFQNMFHAFIR